MAYGFDAATATTTTTNTTTTTTTTTDKEACVGQVADCVKEAQSKASEADVSSVEGSFFKKM